MSSCISNFLILPLILSSNFQIIRLGGVFMPEYGSTQNNNHSNSYDTNGGNIQPVDVPKSNSKKIPANNDGLSGKVNANLGYHPEK
jgi:hypothetical protein